MDDPNNPYSGQYKSWDTWSFENLQSADDLGKSPSHVDDQHEVPVIPSHDVDEHEQRQTTRDGIGVHLDRSGYLIPAEIYLQQRELAKQEGRVEEFYSSVLGTFAKGNPELDMLTEMDAALDAIAAKFYPPVPDWLAARPPKGAMLYPNGDVITLGELGSGESGGKLHHIVNETIYRYDSAGVMVNQTNSSPFYLYYDLQEGGELEGFLTNRKDGVYILTNRDSGAPLSYWSFDGKRLPDGAEPPVGDSHPFELLRMDWLLRLHQAQK
jgi:hypothetical protein